MKFLYDYFPIICFFVAYKLYGIYIATAVTMAASALQVSVFWLFKRRFERMHVITLFFVLLLGGITLLLHDPIFIKWKPSIIYWIFSVVLLASQYLGKRRALIHRMLSDKINMPVLIWHRINLAWAVFFFFLGFLNLYVVYHYSTDAWVNFKLFGTLGLMLVFVIGQALYMARFMEEEK